MQMNLNKVKQLLPLSSIGVFDIWPYSIKAINHRQRAMMFQI